jgi:outer membrane protein insertion porin family
MPRRLVRNASDPGAAVGYGVPISETDTINFGFRYEHTDLTLFDNSPPVYFDYVRQFGPTTNAFILSAGWSRDTRDDIIYPTKGTLQSALGEWGVPPGDLSYYKLNYLVQNFWPIYSDFVLMLRGDVGYGDGYGGKPLPFFKAFYAGGVGSVRSYDTASLGPKDILGNRRQAQDRRQRRALLPGPQGRQVGARQRVLRRGADLR